jgi:hypothetical protein
MRLFKGSSNKRVQSVDKLMTRRNDKIIASLRKDRLVKKEVDKVTEKFDSLKDHVCKFKDVGNGWLVCNGCRSFKWATGWDKKKK